MRIMKLKKGKADTPQKGTEMFTYKVHYIANDGKGCSFLFNTDRAFRRFRNNNSNDGISLGTPFINDMLSKAREIGERPDSSMTRHGGFDMSKIRMIECVETGNKMFFASC